MFGSLGLPEILFILVLALLVFGPRRLPEVGRTIGRALGEFRRATGDLKRTFDQETSALERDAALGSAPAAPAETTARPAASGTPAASSPVATDGEPVSVSEPESAAEPHEVAENGEPGVEDREPS